MKRTFVIIVMMAALILAVPATGKCQKTVPKSEKSSLLHLGTWQLASYKYGDQPDFVDIPKSNKHIKLITETHFSWVETDTATRKISSMAGGRYTLNGSTYTESIDYGLGMDTYLGHKQTFTIKVEGDMLFLSGMLSDGYKVEEIWQRVK